MRGGGALPPSGDLAFARITANAGSVGASSQQADIAGLSITFTAPASGAVWLEAEAYTLGQGTVAGNMIWYIADSANAVVMQAFLGNIAANGFSPSPYAKVKVPNLTPGQQYTYKVRASTGGTVAGTCLAGAGFPAYIRAVAA